MKNNMPVGNNKVVAPAERVIFKEEGSALGWKDWYIGFANDIQKHFPDYTIVISGGSYRGYDCSVESIDRDKNVISIDCYLPLRMDSNCKQWAIDFIKQNLSVCTS